MEWILRIFIHKKKDDAIFRVIFVGNLCFRKGSHYLLRALNELKLPNFEFFHVGPVSEEMTEFINSNAPKNFFFHGKQPQENLIKYYAQSSVFCLPSLEEGLAMVQVQAMACGLPIICTPNAGAEDLITDGVEGFLIPIRNVEALKEKISFLYKNTDICSAMGKAASNRVQSSFTWSDYGKSMIEKYAEILSNPL